MGQTPTEWDSVQYVLGVDRFDVRQDSPHAPGYWLYIVAGRAVRALTPFDANRSLVIVAALASAALVVVTYLVGRGLGGEWLGLGAAALVGTSPFVWFYGSVAATYGFDALVGVTLVLLALRARPGSHHVVVAALVLGLAAGFRPTMVVMFAALALLSAVRSIRGLRLAAAALAAGLAGLLAWLVPMLLEQPGGLTAWRSASSTMFLNAAKQTSLLTGSPDGWSNVARAVSATAIALAPAFIAGAIAALMCLVRGTAQDSGGRGSRATLTLIVAGFPGLVFVALTHFPKRGYVLAFLPPLVLLALLPAARIVGPGRTVVALVIAGLTLLNIQQFLGAPTVVPLALINHDVLWIAQGRPGAPYPLTRAEIRRVDERSLHYDRLRAAIDPHTEVIVFDMNHTPEYYRYATYSLPEYRIDLVEGRTVWRTAWGRQQRVVMSHRIIVPQGGDAVLVMDAPSPDVNDLIARGLATPVGLPGGPVAVRIRPGTTLFGLPIAEGDPEPTRVASHLCQS